jgi:hypothetical protein
LPPNNKTLPEEELLEHIANVGRFAYTRTGLHIHISALMPGYRKEHNLRIAAHMFDMYLGRSEGELFHLTSGDFFFIARGIQKVHLQRLVERLRSLFSEDPLISNSTEEKSGFCTIYDLGTQYSELLTDVKIMAAKARYYSETATGPRKPLDTHTLVQLEQILSRADITNYIRNQPVCVVRNARSIYPVFDELYVSIEDLRANVCPEHTLTGDKWLFQYITQILDRRMLQYLAQNDSPLQERVCSFNLNISTILSPEFLNFDANLTAKTRGGRIVIEIQKHDIFADMGAYAFAEQYLHEQTHRLSLDGITYQTLPFIDREKLRLDFIKLGWSPEILERWELISGPLKEDITRIGADRFILMHCDSAQALEVGKELGITMYQGRYVSTLLQNARPAGKVRAKSS